MPDWERYRQTFLIGDMKAQNLERLRTMQTWIELPFEQCAAAAQKYFAGKETEEVRPWYQLSRSLFLKFMKAAGFDGPNGEKKQQEILALYQEGKASPDQVKILTHIANVNQIGTVIFGLQPEATRLSPGALAGIETWQQIHPLADSMMTVNVTPAYVNAAAIEKLGGVLEALLKIGNEVAPDNSNRPLAFYWAGETAFALGDGSANMGESSAAFDWYSKSATYYNEANEPDKVSEARRKAALLEYQVTGDIDRVMQRILGPLYDPAHPPEPFAAAVAYADLSQVMQRAGDKFGAGQQAARAANSFEKLEFRDPEIAGADVALDSWVSRSCDLASGKPVFALLMRVCQAYSAVYAGRVAQFVVSNPGRALKAQQLAGGMNAIVAQIATETQAAAKGLEGEVEDYFPDFPPFSKTPEKKEAMPDKELLMAQVDEALIQLRALTEAKSGAGEPVQPVLAMLEQLKPLADAVEMPLYSAKWQMGYCNAQIAAADKEAALKAAEAAIAALLRGRPPKLSSLMQMERPPYLEALLWKMRLLMMLGRLQDGLSTCLLTIDDFEESRGRVNSPLQQSSLLESAIEFYRGAAFAAFKLQDWEMLLRVTELVKARSALRGRLRAGAPDAEFQALAKQFDQLTMALQTAADPQVLDDTKARRRDVFDLMAIARARNEEAAPAPSLTIAAVQKILRPDEALLGYFYLNTTVFLIVRLDRDRCEVERVVCKDDDLAPVNELLDAIENLDTSGPLDLDDAIATAGNILLTPDTRQFLQDKKRAIISPHHRLHLFPFHAAGWDGKLLVERCAVRYVPNFGSLLLEWKGRTGAGVFALGVSRFSIARQNWPELRNTEQQVREIHDIYSAAGHKAAILTGSSATTETFRTLAAGDLGNYSALHLATHGTSVFSPEAQDEPMESKLVLEDGCIDGLELATLHLPADVAVLSACNSGQRAVGGRGMTELPGDEIFGLQAALFQAGVHTVLGTLWPVETKAAYTITLDFHANYAKGDSAEIALQKAILSFFQSTGRTGTFLWAPFFLSSLGSPNTAETVN